jgi:protein-disulfide isomerase
LQKGTHLTFVGVLLSFLLIGAFLLSASTNVRLFSYTPYVVYGQTGSPPPDNSTALGSTVANLSYSQSSTSYNNTTYREGGNGSSNKLALSNLIQGGAPYLGNTNASITIIDFSDFQCSKCARYVKNTEPQIKSQYVETGKVALVFQHFPRLGADSVSAALASQCVAEQGNENFWQFHDILYQNQGPENSGWANKDNLKQFASQVPGIDKEAFNICLDNEKYKQYIENDLALVKELGFQDTPSFIIEKSDGTEPEKLVGPYPFASFQFIIDNKLKNSS